MLDSGISFSNTCKYSAPLIDTFCNVLFIDSIIKKMTVMTIVFKEEKNRTV